MDWFKRSANLAYFPTHDGPLKNHWLVLRSIGEKIGLSSSAKEKLEWMIFYHTVASGNATTTARYFNISRKTLHKWLKRFDDKNLKTLEGLSRSPHTKRTWTITFEEQERIKDLRLFSKCKWGKRKLKRLYFKRYGIHISAHKIQRVINKLNLYPDTKEHILRLKRKRSRKNKTYINTFKTKKQLGYLWHTDSIIIWWYGERRVIFTALEDQTKIAFGRVYKSSSSSMATDFLKRLIFLSNNEIINIHHDNGSEFEKEFEKACKNLSIKQIYSRVRTPKDNPALERFNYTIQDEWLQTSEVGLDNLDEANLDLTSWLVKYNNIRPHESLDYLTPLEYAVANFKVSPMWSARTQY